MAHIRIGSYRIRVPRSRRGRTVLGGALVAGGVMSWLPVLGLWMLPAGLVVLSVDSPRVRRFRRRQEVKTLRWWRRQRSQPG
jgi:hypothetical protein